MMWLVPPKYPYSPYSRYPYSPYMGYPYMCPLPIRGPGTHTWAYPYMRALPIHGPGTIRGLTIRGISTDLERIWAMYG